jgi:hypothetical protein
MTRLIVIVGADRRQGISVIETLLEYPNEWRIRGIMVDPTSFDTQVQSPKWSKFFDPRQKQSSPLFPCFISNSGQVFYFERRFDHHPKEI